MSDETKESAEKAKWYAERLDEERKHLISKTCGNRYVTASLSEIKIPEDFSQRFMEWLKQPKNILLYSGSAGCGKTHFCASIFNYFSGNTPSIPFWKEQDFLGRVRASIDMNGDYSEIIKQYCRDILVIYDDMG